MDPRLPPGVPPGKTEPFQDICIRRSNEVLRHHVLTIRIISVFGLLISQLRDRRLHPLELIKR
jgi:hypothetical protein